jgi:hypothetical protein
VEETVLVQDLDFNPDIPKNVLQQAKDWLFKNRKSFTSNGNYAVFNQEGDVQEFLSAACHNGIQSPLQHRNRCIVATEIGTLRNTRYQTNMSSNYGGHKLDKELTLDTADDFLHWMTQESWMSRFILNRDDPAFIREYGILISADMNVALMQNICITSRHFHECTPRAFFKFSELIKAGIPKEFAFNSCFCTSYSHYSYGDTQKIQSICGHRALPLLTLQGLKNLIKGELSTGYSTGYARDYNDPRTHYRNFIRFEGGLNAFQDKPEASVTDNFLSELLKIEEFKKALREFRTGAKEEVFIPNPFTRRTKEYVDENDISPKEFFELAIPYVLEKGLLYEDGKRVAA